MSGVMFGFYARNSITINHKQTHDDKSLSLSKKAGGRGIGHNFLNLYRATLPLSAIFLLDILPSRLSLVIIGHLTSDIYFFNSIFLSYSFTNFFSVFILSLSCGLDTLSKIQLRNIIYTRYAIILVLIGLIPYIFCSIYSENILSGIGQPIEIITYTGICCRYLILYAICYIIFAMLRKSLLQYLHTTLLIGFMFARLCIHLVIGYSLFYYTDLSFYSFIISDSVSMAILLYVTIITLSRMINLTTFIKDLFSSSPASTVPSKPLMSPNNTSDDIAAGDLSSTLESEGHLSEYLSATMIPGTISCLEWWAVETFTFLVGALPLISSSNIINLFVHSCWASFLLIFQMPMLGLSVAMAAIMTGYIREAKFVPAKYTFLQAMASVIFYCICVGLLVIFGYDKLLNVFYPITPLNEEDISSKSDMYKILTYSESISVLFVISVITYSISMCFLGIFVSVGRLARGGTFMLIGYYMIGLVLAVILGYIADWGLYGVWFGYCGGFCIWCLLSTAYWVCTDWINEMSTMKAGYDDMEKRKSKMFKSNIKNYGSTMNK